jgi:cobalt-zinc-cadmium efflux system membrane fusion protein
MQAVLNSNGDTHDELNDLQIEFVASNIDVQSRTLKFYLPVRNELLRDETDAAGRRYIMWKYRPGQRMTLRVPVEKFDQQIVVPVDAVADDGAESFVFWRTEMALIRLPCTYCTATDTALSLQMTAPCFPEIASR